MRQPADIPTQETAAFLLAHLRAGSRLLEVGCGEGHVAAVLRDAGIRVFGLEANLERAREAWRRGVPCVLGSWPLFESLPLDAIAFTRSIHHIDPLDASVVQARALLDPAGVLLIEDFAVHEVTSPTLQWFLAIIRSRTARTLLEPVPDELVTDLLAADEPETAWAERHDHIHPYRAIEDTVRSHFEVRYTATAPYFYRYLVYVLPPTFTAAAFLESVFQEESRLAVTGDIAPLGRRIVATLPGGASWKP